MWRIQQSPKVCNICFVVVFVAAVVVFLCNTGNLYMQKKGNVQQFDYSVFKMLHNF